MQKLIKQCNDSNTKHYLYKFGCRIRNQLNGIKRPIDIASKELNLNELDLQNCVDGNLAEDEVKSIVNKITDRYPIKLSDLYLEKDYTKNGVLYKPWKNTQNSSR
eukprot:299735_1